MKSFLSTMKPEHKSVLIIIATILLALVGAGLLISSIVFLFVFPPKPSLTVTNASLTQFKLTGNNLTYNFTLDLTIKYTNKLVAMHYKSVQVVAEYGNEDFATISLPPFRQRHRNTTNLHTNLQGHWLSMRFSESDLAQFKAESAVGVYSIDVEATMKVKEYVRYYKLEWVCSLKLPLSSSDASPSPSTFRNVNCRPVSPEKQKRRRRSTYYYIPRKKIPTKKTVGRD